MIATTHDRGAPQAVAIRAVVASVRDLESEVLREH